MSKYENTSQIICPYCGYEDTDSWEREVDGGGDELDCHSCGKTFYCSKDVTVSYTTNRLCKGGKHEMVLCQHHPLFDYKECLNCGENYYYHGREGTEKLWRKEDGEERVLIEGTVRSWGELEERREEKHLEKRRLTMSNETEEKWGCWDGEDEQVPSIEPTKEGAIAMYANDELLNELPDEKATMTFEAVVSKGRPVVAFEYAPDINSLIETVNEAVYDVTGNDDLLVDMSDEELESADLALREMFEKFFQEHIKQRDWTIFESYEKIVIKFVDGEYAGWEESDEKSVG